MPWVSIGDVQKKVACGPCIRGHRSSKCEHDDRVLLEVRKPGRPLSSCPHPSGSCSCERVVINYAIPKASECACPPTAKASSEIQPLSMPSNRVRKPKRPPAARPTAALDRAIKSKKTLKDDSTDRPDSYLGKSSTSLRQTASADNEVRKEHGSSCDIEIPEPVAWRRNRDSDDQVPKLGLTLEKAPHHCYEQQVQPEILPSSPSTLLQEGWNNPETRRHTVELRRSPKQSTKRVGRCCSSSKSHPPEKDNHQIQRTSSNTSSSSTSNSRPLSIMPKHSGMVKGQSGVYQMQFSNGRSGFSSNEPDGLDYLPVSSSPLRKDSFTSNLLPDPVNPVEESRGAGISNFHVPVPDDNLAKWLPHNCNCGENCECFGCAAHPQNQTTTNYLRYMHNLMIENNSEHPPQDNLFTTPHCNFPITNPSLNINSEASSNSRSGFKYMSETMNYPDVPQRSATTFPDAVQTSTFATSSEFEDNAIPDTSVPQSTEDNNIPHGSRCHSLHYIDVGSHQAMDQELARQPFADAHEVDQHFTDKNAELDMLTLSPSQFYLQQLAIPSYEDASNCDDEVGQAHGGQCGIPLEQSAMSNIKDREMFQFDSQNCLPDVTNYISHSMDLSIDTFPFVDSKD